jgi:uncharacterized membrane protein YraQ (UPF0718 family)
MKTVMQIIVSAVAIAIIVGLITITMRQNTRLELKVLDLQAQIFELETQLHTENIKDREQIMEVMRHVSGLVDMDNKLIRHIESAQNQILTVAQKVY